MHIQAANLERIVERIFGAAGCQPAEASSVARHFVDSNLCGHDSHGVIRVSLYLDFIRAGKVRPGSRMTVVFESDTVAVVDGNLGFGQVICEQAMDLLAAKAETSGLAMTAVRNSGHVGRLGPGPNGWPSVVWCRSISSTRPGTACLRRRSADRTGACRSIRCRSAFRSRGATRCFST